MVILKARPRYATKRCWAETHNQFVYDADRCSEPLALFGASIVAGLTRYKQVWELFQNIATNCGIGGDRVENVLWRIENGEVPIHCRYVFVNIGSNNIHDNSIEDIIDTICHVVIRLHDMSKAAIIHGIHPRDDKLRGSKFCSKRERTEFIGTLNMRLEERCNLLGVKFVIPRSEFYDIFGGINRDVYIDDGLHLNAGGNSLFAKAILNTYLEVSSIGRPNPVLDSYALGQFESIGAQLSHRPATPPLTSRTSPSPATSPWGRIYVPRISCPSAFPPLLGNLLLIKSWRRRQFFSVILSLSLRMFSAFNVG